MYLVCLHPNNKTKSFMKIKVPILEKEIKDLMELRLSMVEAEKAKEAKKKKKECYVCKKTKGTKTYIVDQYLMGTEKYRYCKRCANIWLNTSYTQRNIFK